MFIRLHTVFRSDAWPVTAGILRLPEITTVLKSIQDCLKLPIQDCLNFLRVTGIEQESGLAFGMRKICHAVE